MKRIVAVRARPRDSCVPASFLLVADACLSAQYTDKGVRIQSQIVESVIQENRVMVATLRWEFAARERIGDTL